MTIPASPPGPAFASIQRVALVATFSVIAAAVLAACQPVVGPASATAVQTPPPAPSVAVAPVIQRDIEPTLVQVGRVESSQRVELRPRVAGHIEAVLFKEGDLVRTGQPLFRIDPRPFDAALQRARAELALAQARTTLARSDAERAERLAAEQAIAKEELERRNAAYAEAQARNAAAEAAVKTAALDREFAVIHAPISGRIGRAFVTAGNYVGVGGAQPSLATLVATSPLHVHFDVAEPSVLERLAAGRNTASWRTRVLDARTGQELALAPIDFTDNEMVAGAGTLRLRARVDSPDSRLVPGQFVRAQLLTGTAQPALLVQDKAIGTDQGRRYVLVVDAQGSVEYRPILVGAMHDDLRIVSAGLKAGERVVVSGLLRVRPGMTVQPHPAAGDTAPAAQASASGSARS